MDNIGQKWPCVSLCCQAINNSATRHMDQTDKIWHVHVLLLSLLEQITGLIVSFLLVIVTYSERASNIYVTCNVLKCRMLYASMVPLLASVVIHCCIWFLNCIKRFWIHAQGFKFGFYWDHVTKVLQTLLNIDIDGSIYRIVPNRGAVRQGNGLKFII